MSTDPHPATPPTTRRALRAIRAIDAREGTDVFAITKFGARVAVRTNDPAIIPRLQSALPAGVRRTGAGDADGSIALVVQPAGRSGGSRKFSLLGASARVFGPFPAVEELLDDFEAQVRFTLAQFSRRLVFVHAGVVGWRGRAVVIPGRTYSGKSSLVAALVKAGAEYVSDEHAILDDRGFVYPWLKPLSLRERGRHRPRLVWPGDLGADVATTPLPVRLIVSTMFRPRSRWRPRPLSAAQGALELMGHTLAAHRDPGRVMDVVAAVAARALTVKTHRPDAARVAPRILHLLEHGA